MTPHIYDRPEDAGKEKNDSSLIANEGYEPEAASNLFEELEETLHMMPHYREAYNILYDVFQKSLTQKIADRRLVLSGLFAKTDYLLKEYKASNIMTRRINDTRVRLRQRHELTDDDLERWHPYDLRNICQFIAFVYGVEIPASLKGTFPKEYDEESRRAELIGDSMRVIVDGWDDTFVYATAESGSENPEVKICYTDGNKIYPYDWSYLKDILYKGAQLNLIRPRGYNDTLYPELIIFEPDYLVDISTIARCFTNYSEEAIVNLLNKIQPSASTEPIVLGNLAGQMLDEQIHELPATRSYGDTVRDFWQNNSISMLTTDISPTFHNEAMAQKKNIAHAIGEVLPGSVASFDCKECMVEPSFFSEMLGLQGRMDMLQLDYKILLEQKSGKGEFPYDNFVIPRHREEHYVQLLLYMLLIRYNFRERYEENNRELHAFLLYSKYSESLLGLGFAPELIFRAIKVRNDIVRREMAYAKEDGFRILETLTPEMINTKQTHNPLWNRYQEPQIRELLAPIRSASEVEREYYFRFLTFIANEHMLSKLGSMSKEGSGFAAIWHDSLEEKLQTGNIYEGLTLLYPSSESEGNIRKVRLKFAETESNNMSNFRVGDIVILYPYAKGSEPDARKTMVFRCTIDNIGIDTIDLALRAVQSDPKVFLMHKNKLWAIEHDFIESSYSSLYRGMHAFLTAPKQRRDLILLQREPEIDRSRRLNGDYGPFNELSLRVKQAKDLFLIIGPPGTGKTSYGLLNTLMEELTEEGSTVLLLSYTNRAVDEICSKLHEQRIDFVRIGGGATCSPEYRDNLLSLRAQSCKSMMELKAMIAHTRVLVATTTAMSANIGLFQLKQFSLAIIDEASQILEPHLMGILSAQKDGVPAIRKMVLIGDHKQLPAVVQQSPEVSEVNEEVLNEVLLTDCRLSLFERLLKRYRGNDDVVYMLRRQGRMHHDIAIFPNHAFYNNRLEEVPLPHQNMELLPIGRSDNGIDNLLSTRRIAFLHVPSPRHSISDKVNSAEADVIAATVVRIYEMERKNFSAEETVGVIVPYRNQIATIRKRIDESGIKVLHDITIDTVERYQGSQRKYIIYGFTIQRYYQLSFLTNNVFEDWDGSVIDRKLNVAMTRAEEHLLLVGDTNLLSNNFTFFKLMEFVKSRHGFFNIPVEDYVEGRFDVPEYQADELDISRAVFGTSEAFDSAFREHVLTPIEEDAATELPSLIFGNDMSVNLNAIGYGRLNISNQMQMFGEDVLTPQRQVLIYCYYIMRQYYCSSRIIYSSYAGLIERSLNATDGRLQMVDIGCGPFTCGIAFAEQFLAVAPQMVYNGIDISSEMIRMGRSLADSIFGTKLNYQTRDSFGSLGRSYWEGCSELPSTVVFNLSYLFANITSQLAEGMASQILDVMERYPLNRYLFVIQQSESDGRLNSFKAFRRIIAPHVAVVRNGDDELGYRLNDSEQQLKFCYNIWVRG